MRMLVSHCRFSSCLMVGSQSFLFLMFSHVSFLCFRMFSHMYYVSYVFLCIHILAAACGGGDNGDRFSAACTSRCENIWFGSADADGACVLGGYACQGSARRGLPPKYTYQLHQRPSFNQLRWLLQPTCGQAHGRIPPSGHVTPYMHPRHDPPAARRGKKFDAT